MTVSVPWLWSRCHLLSFGCNLDADMSCPCWPSSSPLGAHWGAALGKDLSQ